jgi:hypothetical protein
MSWVSNFYGITDCEFVRKIKRTALPNLHGKLVVKVLFSRDQRNNAQQFIAATGRGQSYPVFKKVSQAKHLYSLLPIG